MRLLHFSICYVALASWSTIQYVASLETDAPYVATDVPSVRKTRQAGNTNGGISDRKKELISGGAAYVNPQLRLLFFYPNDTIRADVNFAEVVVCKGIYAQGHQYTVCPTASVGGSWSSYGDLLSPGFLGDVYCCGRPGLQTCCSADRFFSRYPTAAPTEKPWVANFTGIDVDPTEPKKPKKMSTTMVVVFVCSCLGGLVVVILVSVLVCCLCNCCCFRVFAGGRGGVGGGGGGGLFGRSRGGGAVYGPGGGAYPTGGGAYPTGGGAYPTGGGAYPTGGGAYPTGGGAYPTGGGAYPAGGGGGYKGGLNK